MPIAFHDCHTSRKLGVLKSNNRSRKCKINNDATNVNAREITVAIAAPFSDLPQGINIAIVPYQHHDARPIPLVASTVSAGFPSPAEDYLDTCLDLNDLVVKHPAATFFVRVKGHSMIDAGINTGDVLVVDRALEPAETSIVIAVLDGEFTVKRISLCDGCIFLIPANRNLDPIPITEDIDFQIWGVVTHVIHKL